VLLVYAAESSGLGAGGGGVGGREKVVTWRRGVIEPGVRTPPLRFRARGYR
jgi:hypothetical protein